MKGIFVSSIRDESELILKLAEENDFGIEILGFVEPHKLCNYDILLDNTRGRLSNVSKRALHGPFLDLFPGSIDPEIINVVRRRFLDAYRTAKELKAQHIIFHAGYIPKAAFPNTWLDNSARFWNSFLSEVDDHMKIYIENVCEDDYGLLRELIQAVNSPKLSICLDVGHANIHSKYTLKEWIQDLHNTIKYVHLHNNDGIHDKHWGLCKGNIEIVSILELLEAYAPDAYWSLETKADETEESIQLLKKADLIGY